MLKKIHRVLNIFVDKGKKKRKNWNGGLHACARDARIHYTTHIHTYIYIRRERERVCVQKKRASAIEREKKRANETDLVSVLSWRPYLLYVVALIT